MTRHRSVVMAYSKAMAAEQSSQQEENEVIRRASHVSWNEHVKRTNRKQQAGRRVRRGEYE